ncbi:MAG: hypothetical protein N0C90_11575 [Candidatus Thiodiazotropha endolucinida]|nr:hypothetical protein [Candidatus Thiodiazotropha taylori]MCW4261999.1 hypothetical protein [Candidatus Thiodiazotropha endolucinida]
MRISIRHDSEYIVEFDQLSINGREAVGGYAFNFLLNGSRQGCESQISVFAISLSLSLSGSVKPIVTYIPSSTQLVQCFTFPNNSEQLHFEVVLTREQINAIEENRREKDLILNLGLRALTSSGGSVWPSFESTDVTVPREHWLGALKNSGFRQTLLFEVPLPSVADELIALLSKAQEFIETGHYKDAVMQCRHIIEHVETIRGDKNLSIAANKMSQTRQEREVMTAIERMLNLREQLKNVCQLGAHGSEYFTRSQAKAVLGMTMALLAEPTVGFTKLST